GRRFLEAIDRGLSIRPEERPRTVGEFRSMLFAASPGDGIQGSHATGAGADDATQAGAQPPEAQCARPAAKRRPASRPPLTWAPGGAAAVFVAVVAWFAIGDGAPTSSAVAAAPQLAAVPAPAASRSLASPASTSVASTAARDASGAVDGHASDAPGRTAANPSLVAKHEPQSIDTVAQTGRPVNTRVSTALAP